MPLTHGLKKQLVSFDIVDRAGANDNIRAVVSQAFRNNIFAFPYP